MENASSKDPWNQEIPLAPWGMPPRSWVGTRSSSSRSSWSRVGADGRGARAGRRIAVRVGQGAAFGGGMGSSLRFLQALTDRATVRAGTAIHMSFIVPTLETGWNFHLIRTTDYGVVEGRRQGPPEGSGPLRFMAVPLAWA
jgi:hypothetical protein